MSLADYQGEYLGSGWHDVLVVSVREFEAKTTTQGVEFELKGQQDAKAKVSFYITEKALWRLAAFAVACGLTKEQLQLYNENSLESHRTLCGRRVKVLLEKGEKYHDVTDWAPIGSKVEEPTDVKPENPKVDRSAPVDSDDDIPF